MTRFKSYGCVLEDDEQFCNLWTQRQARSIWGEAQLKPIREAWKDKLHPTAPPPNIGFSTRPINFNAVPKPAPARTIPWKYSKLRDKK